MNSAQKLENPERLRELSPEKTLRRIGLTKNHTLCDIGAGSGIFTIPAARITAGTVYALDLRNDFLQLIDEKAEEERLDNVHTMLVKGTVFGLPDKTADIALMATVLHEVRDKAAFLRETLRVLKDGGKAVLIEFHPRRTPIGPPPERRLSKEEVERLFSATGFTSVQEFDFGENFYCVVFRK